jgi:Spy/CpxP family protein refolding chaperone
MNRWIHNLVTLASVAGSLALLPAGVAFAQDAGPQAQPADAGHAHGGHHRHGPRLLGAALKLDSLTPAQRSQIEQLVAQRKAAEVPVRQADAQVLTVLAQQVEQAKVDDAALAPSLAAKHGAAVAAQRVDQAALAQLHAVLTPAQRIQLVDGIEARSVAARGATGGAVGVHGHAGGGKLGLTDAQRAQVHANLQAEGGAAGHHGQGAQRKAALDSFRGDSFDAGALAQAGRGEDRELRMTRAMIPVLTPNQRATLAAQLRHRAAREGRG